MHKLIQSGKRVCIGLLVLSLSLLAPMQTLALSDIDGHTYQTAIESLTDLGIINGYPDGSYRPDQTINRAEFLKIVIGAFQSNIGYGSSCFPDVQNEWFARYICYGKNQGIIQGYPDNFFRPARTVNYAEALKMLYEANGDKGNAYGSQWYSPYLDDAIAHGIAIRGLDANHLMRRGEIAELVSRYADKKDITLEMQDTETTTDPNEDEPQEPQEPEAPVDLPPVSDAGNVGIDMDWCNSTQISGNAIYVSPNGNDGSGNGSLDNPYRSVAHALDNTPAGSTLVLRDGRYIESERLRVSEPNITIRSMPGEWGIIDRSADTEMPAVWFYVGSDGGKLQCAEVTGGFYAVSTETKWDWGEADRSGSSNITIEHAKLHDSGRDVVKIKPNSDDITIRFSEIYNSGQAQSPGDCNAEGIDNVNGDRMLVQNNYIHDTCSTGVYFKGGATDGIVENNVIENPGGAGVIIGFDTSPEYFDTDVNPDYYENIRGIVRNNLIRDAGWAGIALYASKDAQVYNNTIVDSASTYHSPIYFGVTFQDWVDYAGRPANVNPTIQNNVISQSASLDAPIISIRQTDELGGLSGLEGGATMSGNCYYQAGGSAQFEDDRTQVDMGGWYGDWTGSLSEWQSHMNTDLSSIEANPQMNADFEAGGACAGKGYKK